MKFALKFTYLKINISAPLGVKNFEKGEFEGKILFKARTPHRKHKFSDRNMYNFCLYTGENKKKKQRKLLPRKLHSYFK